MLKLIIDDDLNITLDYDGALSDVVGTAGVGVSYLLTELADGDVKTFQRYANSFAGAMKITSRHHGKDLSEAYKEREKELSAHG